MAAPSATSDDVSRIEKAIMEAGLFPYIDWQLREFPPELYEYCGKGIGLWQYPIQFAKYMHFIKENFNEIKSYAEIGVAGGGTFIFTTQFLGPAKSYAVDIAGPGAALCTGTTPFADTLKTFLETNPQAEFVTGDCTDLRTILEERGEKIDLLLIDGDHSYDGVKKDFECLKDLAHIIVFHDVVSDVCDGVVRFWNEIKANGSYPTFEFVDQYDSVQGSFLGIGVALMPSSAEIRRQTF